MIILKTIYLAGGCFWGVEAYFQKVNGVIDTTVGYAQGEKEFPNYEEVCTGKTGYAEAVEVVYDETVVSMEQLFDNFFHIINPTALNVQGNDYGTQYRTGIYSQFNEDLACASAYIQLRQKEYSEPIVVEVELLSSFYAAEEYHQDYLIKNPGGYCHINLTNILGVKK